jgi:hypothetical protein
MAVMPQDLRIQTAAAAASPVVRRMGRPATTTGDFPMCRLIIAAAALAACSAAPALAGEGTFQPTATASGFMARMMASAGEAMRLGTSFQYNNAGNYGDTFQSAPRGGSWMGSQVRAGSFVYNMSTGNG